MFAPRAPWVAKRGSVGELGLRPSPCTAGRTRASALAAMTTSAPSAVGYTFDGATPGSTLPVRVRTTPPSS